MRKDSHPQNVLKTLNVGIYLNRTAFLPINADDYVHWLEVTALWGIANETNGVEKRTVEMVNTLIHSQDASLQSLCVDFLEPHVQSSVVACLPDDEPLRVDKVETDLEFAMVQWVDKYGERLISVCDWKVSAWMGAFEVLNSVKYHICLSEVLYLL